MTTSVAVFPPGFRVTDANDNPVSGATIEFYSAATTTPKTVYSDSDLTIPIGTSVTTDAGGYPTSGGNKTLVYVDTAYKVIIKDADGAVIATHDRVPGPVGGSTSSTSTASTTFGMGVGDVKISSAATPDAGFIRLAETEQSLLKADYPDLTAWCAAQGYPWGSTSTTFDIPRAAGYFLRFAATSSSIDTAGARVAGSIQGDQYAAHTHANTASASTSVSHNANANYTPGTISGSGVSTPAIVHSSGASITASTTVTLTNASSGTGTETRAKNVAFHADMLAVPALVSAGLVGAAGLAYRFNSTTSGASVTTGTLAFNNATLTSATALYVYETDANSTNLAGVLQGIPTGSLFYMAKVGAPANWIAATVSSTATDAGSYDSFTLSSVQTGGTISNGDLLTVTVMRAGVAGAAGEAGAAGVDGATAIYVQSSAPSVNNGALWIRTTDGEVFKCIAGSWTDQGYTTNGATGATGSAGAGVPTGGTTGQVLKKNSGTDYDTSWGTALGGSGSPSVPQGRLTLTTAVPVLTSTVSGATTVYYTPYVGQYVPLYDGSTWTMTDVAAELSQTTTDTTKSPAACTTNSNYDLFVWSDSGTYRCTRGPAWSSDTARGTGAGTTELQMVAGIYTNKNAITNGPGANRGTYVGTIRTNGSSQVDVILGASGTASAIGVWNAYNRVVISTYAAESTANWTYNSTTWRGANGGTLSRASFVRGLDEDMVDAIYQIPMSGGASGDALIGINLDSTSATPGGIVPYFSIGSNIGAAPAAYSGMPGIGWHYLQAMERQASTGSAAGFYNNNYLSLGMKAGLIAKLRA